MGLKVLCFLQKTVGTPTISPPFFLQSYCLRAVGGRPPDLDGCTGRGQAGAKGSPRWRGEVPLVLAQHVAAGPIAQQLPPFENINLTALALLTW